MSAIITTSIIEPLLASSPMTMGLAGLAVLGAGFAIYKLLKPKKKAHNFLPGVVYLYTFPPGCGSVSGSPFCTKLETYLRVAKIPVITVRTTSATSPNGKWPFIRYNHKVMADTELIMQFLNAEFNVNLDLNLAPLKKSFSQAYRVMFEEHFYFGLVRTRWDINENFKTFMRPLLVASIPFPLSLFLPSIIQNSVRKSLIAQGMGRHSLEDMNFLMEQDIHALDIYLTNLPHHGNGYFHCGNAPTSIDIALCGVLMSLVNCNPHEWKFPLLQKLSTNYPSVKSYGKFLVEAIYGADFSKIMTGNAPKYILKGHCVSESIFKETLGIVDGPVKSLKNK